MLGLPFEEQEDIAAIAELCNEIAALYYETVPKEQRHGRIQITASSSFFVPKPFTAFQYAAMDTPERFIEKAQFLKKTVREQLNQKSITYHYHEAQTTIIEGIFARGDRRVAPAIEHAYRHGALFDAWTEYFSYERWMDAFAACGVDYENYIYRERATDELFPWDFIDCGVNKSYLEKEWQRAREAVVTQNCRDHCAGCGCASYQCGICMKTGGGA